MAQHLSQQHALTGFTAFNMCADPETYRHVQHDESIRHFAHDLYHTLVHSSVAAYIVAGRA
jgi:hypothetical protein